MSEKYLPMFKADKDKMKTLGDLAFNLTLSVLENPNNYDYRIIAALPDFIRLFGDTDYFTRLS